MFIREPSEGGGRLSASRAPIEVFFEISSQKYGTEGFRDGPQLGLHVQKLDKKAQSVVPSFGRRLPKILQKSCRVFSRLSAPLLPTGKTAAIWRAAV